jgi:hypothetical protein
MLRRVRVAFFTAGTTGAGHLVRGLAIRRALQRAGSRAEYAMFGPRPPYGFAHARGRAPGLAPFFREVAIDHDVLRDPARAADSEIARALRAYAPDVLLVDLFWAPLRNVLPLAGCEAWLLVRSVPEKWFVGPPGHPYERDRFARVIAIEPGAGLGHEDETIAPVVIANPDEQRPRGALRDALGVRAAGEERLVVVQQAGAPGEWAALLAHAAHAAPAVVHHVFTFGRDDETDASRALAESAGPRVRLHDGADFFPLSEWLADADEVVSGVGYNAFWESRWLGYAGRTRFVPFARRIDDQSWRLRACAGLPLAQVMSENGADVLARRLL